MNRSSKMQEAGKTPTHLPDAPLEAHGLRSATSVGTSQRLYIEVKVGRDRRATAALLNRKRCSSLAPLPGLDARSTACAAGPVSAAGATVAVGATGATGARSVAGAATLRTRCERNLQQLQAAVAALPREARRDALEKLPSRVRAALLRFMERSSERGDALANGVGASIVSHRATADTMAVARTQTRPSTRVGLCLPFAAVRRATMGVSQKRGGYLAQLRLAPQMQAVTRCAASREEAKALHAVLATARDIFAQARGANALVRTRPDDDDAVDAVHMLAAVDAACAYGGITPNDLGLSFCAVVDAHGLAGRSVVGSHTTSIHEALAHRRRLVAGKELGWLGLRAAWIEVMQARVSTRTSRVWGRAKPRPKCAEEATRVADGARRAREAKVHAIEAARCRRCLASAVGRVVSALEAGDASRRALTRVVCHAELRERQVAERLAKSAARLARKERWRWMNDPVALCVRS